MSSSYELKFC